MFKKKNINPAGELQSEAVAQKLSPASETDEKEPVCQAGELQSEIPAADALMTETSGAEALPEAETAEERPLTLKGKILRTKGQIDQIRQIVEKVLGIVGKIQKFKFLAAPSTIAAVKKFLNKKGKKGTAKKSKKN